MTTDQGGAEYTVLIAFEGPVLGSFAMVRHRERGWELPGGRVEPGEAWDVAARREWHEETGLDLAHLEPLLLHHRPDGSRGHVCLGMAARRDASGTLAVAGDTGEAVPGVTEQEGNGADEKIEEVRWVRRLADVSPLAFPDDPYGKVARAILGRRRGGPWHLPEGESEAVFVQRLAVHPDAAPKGHKVEAHPAAAGP